MVFKRPENDFWVCSLKSSLEIVANHARAGFAQLDESVVRDHEFVLFDFLFQNGLIIEQLALSASALLPETSLHNRHLTDTGYYFLQRFLPRWQGRLYKHTTAAKERAFLEKWYRQFVAEQAQPGIQADRP
jgi:hypothetical protein